MCSRSSVSRETLLMPSDDQLLLYSSNRWFPVVSKARVFASLLSQTGYGVQSLAAAV